MMKERVWVWVWVWFWRFGVSSWFGWFAWLVGVESGSKVVFCWIAFAFAFAFAFALLCCWCCWESLWFKGEKGGRVLVVR